MLHYAEILEIYISCSAYNIPQINFISDNFLLSLLQGHGVQA